MKALSQRDKNRRIKINPRLAIEPLQAEIDIGDDEHPSDDGGDNEPGVTTTKPYEVRDDRKRNNPDRLPTHAADDAE